MLRPDARVATPALPIAERIRRIEAATLPRNIPALLAEATADSPTQEVFHFIDSNASLTFRELSRRVAHVAAGLHRAGVALGTHVAVMLPNVEEMPITWLALARLGAVMVPVNVRYTGHELHYMLTDSNASFLVLHRDYLDALATMPSIVAGLEGRVYVVSDPSGPHRNWQSLLEGDPGDLSAVADPDIDALLNIQYTSGTTGSPKGCMLTQRYWLVCARTYSDWDFMAYPRILAANPFFYMTPQWQLLVAMMQRGTLVVAPGLSATQFMKWVRDYRINFCLFRNAYYRQPPDPRDADNEIVRVNIYEHLKENHADMERRYGFPVRSGFGMTEIGAGMITPVEATEMTGTGTCGMAAPWRECRIADPEGNTLPDGVPGELLIRGQGLFLGYYGKPQATAEAFHGDWFRTGDLAYRDERGYFYIVGRLKDMIRRAGENIAAVEVESVIADIAVVAEVAVLGVPDAMRGEEVKACVVLDPSTTPEQLPPEAIVEHCRKRLAIYKVPRYIEYRREALPRTASGKVRKQMLGAGSSALRSVWDRTTGQWL